MIPLDKRISDLTLGDIIGLFDGRYVKETSTQMISVPDQTTVKEYMGVKECAELTGYQENYIRQLVFKRKIPYYKTQNRKPLRFKRSEIQQWMSGKKYSPIDEIADTYINNSKRRVF